MSVVTGINLTAALNPLTIPAGEIVASGGAVAVSGTSPNLTLKNFGTIESQGTYTPSIMGSMGQGTLTGNPTAPGVAIGVSLTNGGLVQNGTNGGTLAEISGGPAGIDIAGATGTVVNYGNVLAPGTTTNAGGFGIQLKAGGTITNAVNASVSGNSRGVYVAGGAAAITNFGMITGTNATVGCGIYLGTGGVITNERGGSIAGDKDAIYVMSTSTAGVTVTNAGTLRGSGTSGTAVSLGAGNDRMVVDPAAVFIGKVNGGAGSNVLELTAGAGAGNLAGLGTSFVNFGAVIFDAGAAWTVEIPQGTTFTGAFSGFQQGDAIDLSGLVATSTSYTGGTLTLDDGPAQVAQLAVATAYAANVFDLAPDGHGGTLVTVTPSGSVTVSDTLVANPITFSAHATIPFSGSVASFADTTNPDNIASDFTATINWGDGTTTAGTVAGGSGSPFTVSGSHTYAAGGADTVAVTLNEDPPGTATATADSTALVAVTVVSPNPPPPGGSTADMILREGAVGNYEIYDIGNNRILSGFALGQVGTDYVFAGLGGFDGSDTTDMLLRNSSTGAFEVYDISDNNITGAAPLGQVGLEWQVAGCGEFNGAGGDTDMMLRNTNSGTFEVYDISSNTITSASPIGQVGLEWQVAGFGDFSGNPNETDMVLRNIDSGAFEVYNIANSQLTGAASLGQVGNEWQLAGFGDFSGNPNETDMMLRNAVSGVFELYDINNDKIASAAAIGQVGLEWQVAGFGPFNGNDPADMVLRNAGTGAFEVYDIVNNQLAGAASLGQVGLDFQVEGCANLLVA